VRKKGLLALATVVIVSVLIAAAGGTGQAARNATLKMAIVTDVGGLNDHSFNQAMNAGQLRVRKTLGFQTRVYDTRTAAERLPNLQAAAQLYQLVFAAGFFMTDPIDKVAPKFPKVKFAGVDVSIADLPSHPTNVRGIQFKEQEAGYLVGYITGLVLKQQTGPDVASAIGANTVPAIVRYIAGYEAGVKKSDPKATVFHDYANDPTFNDQAKCKETAINQLGRHTQVIFAVAGGCGLGAISLARQNHIWAIGVDSDQGYLGPQMLTSALKNVANAVYLTSKDFKKSPSKFRTGYNKVFSVKNNGVGYGKISTRVKNRATIIKKVNKIKKLIAAGKIVPPAK
jgi:basic membrane protein A and related proteins